MIYIIFILNFLNKNKFRLKIRFLFLLKMADTIDSINDSEFMTNSNTNLIQNVIYILFYFLNPFYFNNYEKSLAQNLKGLSLLTAAIFIVGEMSGTGN
jgi:hypothetical protein